MKYCKDASKLLKINVVCGNKCPIYDKCPRLILEDATDKGVTRAIKKLLEIENENRKG